MVYCHIFDVLFINISVSDSLKQCYLMTKHDPTKSTDASDPRPILELH